MAESLLNKWIRLRRRRAALRACTAWVIAKVPFSKFLHVKYGPYRLRYHGSHFTRLLWTYGPSYKSEDADVLTKILAPGDTFVDIGANVGALTLCGANAVGSRGTVYSIEPHPRTYRYLLSNLRLNGITNVLTLNCAVGAVSDVTNLSDSNADDQNRIDETGGVQVPLRPLDRLVPAQPVKLLKIDVEGYERLVLRGASTILQNTEYILIEISTRHFRNYGYSPRDVLSQLASAGFRCRTLSGELIADSYTPRSTENILAERVDPS